MLVKTQGGHFVCKNAETLQKEVSQQDTPYTNFFRKKSHAKAIISGSGRKEKVDEEDLFAMAAAINELHSAGREIGLVKLNEVMRIETEQSALRAGKAINLSQLPINGPLMRYVETFIVRHDMTAKTGDMNTINRNERMSCPCGCYVSYILYYAYHFFSPAWCIFTTYTLTTSQ